MRCKLTLALAAALIGGAALAAAAPAQTVVTTTLMPGGDVLTFSGTAKWQLQDRYYFVAKKDARITAVLTPAHRAVVLDVLPANDATRHPRTAGHYTQRVETRLPADGRYAVVVLFDPRVLFEEAPKPAAYRLELKLEQETR